MTDEEKKIVFARLKEKYNPEGSKLRKYQLHLVDTLKEFDAFCREHGIVYYLAYGSLLGAVRHKGFIPWDDDADLWMDRENYQKLERLMRGEYRQLTDNVYVADGIRPELWSPPYAYIDIFLLGDSPNNRLLAWWKEKMAIFMYAMVKCRGRIDAHKFGKFKSYFVLAPLAYLCSLTKWKQLYTKVQMWFSGKSDYVQVYNSLPSDIKRKYPAMDGVWKPIELEFEGYKFLAPKGWDALLTKRYGDYMTLPRTEEIWVHGFADNAQVK